MMWGIVKQSLPEEKLERNSIAGLYTCYLNTRSPSKPCWDSSLVLAVLQMLWAELLNGRNSWQYIRWKPRYVSPHPGLAWLSFNMRQLKVNLDFIVST